MNEQIQRTPGDMIDVTSLAKRSWALFTSKPLEHILASLIVFVLGSVSLGLLMGPLGVGYIRMIVKQERGEDVRVQDVFSGFDRFGAALLTSLIFVVVMSIGMMLLVLPGLFVIAAWGFALWFVALRGDSSTEALASSWSLLKRHAGSVILVLLLMSVVNVVASSVVLAALLSTPLSAIFATLAFEELEGVSDALPPASRV